MGRFEPPVICVFNLRRGLRIFLIFVLALCLCNCTKNRKIADSRAACEINRDDTVFLDGMWKMKKGSLSPSNLYLPGIDDSSWEEIMIPGNWYLQGLDYEGVVWFRRHFSMDKRFLAQTLKLVFEGVDYTADVWLNGHYLGFHKGYFSPFSFLVPDRIKIEGDNVLAVRVNSPHETPNAWSLKKRLIKGVLGHHDTRPGGAWSPRGQEKNTGGIWAPVYLKASRQLTADKLMIKPVAGPDFKSGESAATAGITAMVTLPLGLPENKKQDIMVRMMLLPYNFSVPQNPVWQKHEIRQLGPGVNRLQFDLSFPRVRLWWPWELGRPNLYQLTLCFYKNNTLLDQITEVFGFRNISCNPETMTWHVNGKRFFIRGTNYISTQWLSEMTKEKYARDLALMKAANINAIRVHAYVEGQKFYRICDEMGMMIWQDFPLQWGYTDEPEFILEAVQQAKEMVGFLYNHPSIISWCGHNEPPWDAKWMKYKYRDYDASQNRGLDAALYKTLKEADDSRYVHEYSSTSEHPWFGWYSGTIEDYARPVAIPFITEFGAQALPNYATLKQIFPDDLLWPDSKKDWEIWQYHNFQPKETFEIAGVEMGDNIGQFIANTQYYQARITKCATESYRRQRFSPVAGIFQFMFVENWPSVNWGIVDYLRQPKPAYDVLKKSYQPLLPSIESETVSWKKGRDVVLRIWIINDTHESVKRAGLKYDLKQGDNSIEKGRLDLNIFPDSAAMVKIFKKSGLSPGHFSFQMRIEDQKGKPLSDNEFSFKVTEGDAP